jgi:hypothetical protein
MAASFGEYPVSPDSIRILENDSAESPNPYVKTVL